ncbi:KEOPS complex subunit Pcc1 [Candidatus Hodarchaeum mangrovi]
MIKKINLIIQVDYPDELMAKLINSALRPDNLAKEPMILISKVSKTTLKITSKRMEKIETAVATANDIISSLSLSEEIIEVGKKGKSKD